MARQKSRPQRWQDALNDLRPLIDKLRDAEDALETAEEEEVADSVLAKLKEARSEAAEDVEDGFSVLQDIQSEYSDWRDNLPDSLQDSPTAELLNEVCDLDLEWDTDSTAEEAEEKVDEADGVSLPRGFGRD